MAVKFCRRLSSAGAGQTDDGTPTTTVGPRRGSSSPPPRGPLSRAFVYVSAGGDTLSHGRLARRRRRPYRLTVDKTRRSRTFGATRFTCSARRRGRFYFLFFFPALLGRRPHARSATQHDETRHSRLFRARRPPRGTPDQVSYGCGDAKRIRRVKSPESST